MILAFYIFAALLIYLSFKSFRGGIGYLNYFKREIGKASMDYAPFATVIAPCKGLDEGLEANLTALIEQDYPAYEVVFVVDDVDDAAAGAIEDQVACVSSRDSESRLGQPLTRSVLTCAAAKLVVASKATESSQKVENLREAILHVSGESKILVFVDSDARPAKNWLRHLLSPLEDDTVGAATGYRWFVSDTPALASELMSAWNASIASALGPNTKSNFCWGGSTAIRRDTFESLGIRERWHGTLSDDFTMTRAMNESGLKIYFVPQALTPSAASTTFRELFEFTTRQMKITRVYAPHLWQLSFFGSALFTSVMLAAFLIVLFSDQNTLLVWAAIATLIMVSIFSIGKSWLRLKAVKLVIPDARRQFLPQVTLWLLTPPVFLYNCICALFSRKMTWRGIRYELVSEKETRLLDE